MVDQKSLRLIVQSAIYLWPKKSFQLQSFNEDNGYQAFDFESFRVEVKHVAWHRATGRVVYFYLPCRERDCRGVLIAVLNSRNILARSIPTHIRKNR